MDALYTIGLTCGKQFLYNITAMTSKMADTLLQICLVFVWCGASVRHKLGRFSTLQKSAAFHPHYQSRTVES